VDAQFRHGVSLRIVRRRIISGRRAPRRRWPGR
jgi:hypothetical protein